MIKRSDDLVLRPKYHTAADLFAAIRDKHGPLDIERPPQCGIEPIEPLDADNKGNEGN